MLHAGCQHHDFPYQSLGLRPSHHLGSHRDHAWSLVTFCSSKTTDVLRGWTQGQDATETDTDSRGTVLVVAKVEMAPE